MIDALVIGAGPAGNQAALSLSARGCSVIVLDYRSEIGDKLCSGIIGAECAEEYRIADKFVWRPFASATIVLPDRKWINVVRDEVHAYVIDRAGFIRDIADRAMANGAEYRLGRKVIDVSFDPNGVTVSAIHREETENYRARCVVLAAGFASKLARDTDLDFPHSVGFAAQTTLSGVKGVGSGGASATDVHVFPKGIVPATAFGWIVPTTGDRYFVGLLGREQPKAPMGRFLSGLRELGYRWDGSDGPDPQSAIWGVPLRPSRKSFINRCVLAGDAAGQVKPTTGGGIYYSLRGGDLAAETIAEGLKRDNLSEKFLARYECRWKDEIGRDLRLGTIARMFFERFSDADISRILHAADRSGLFHQDVSFDRHGEFVVKAMKSRVFTSLVRSVPTLATKLPLARRFPAIHR